MMMCCSGLCESDREYRISHFPDMAPPEHPGSGWLQNANGNKNQPTLAPTPDQSEVTRTAPLPEELIARTEGVSKEEEEARRVERAKKAAEESKKREREEEEMCAICCDKLPDLERGVLSCGHVFCFACIHQWSKNSSICPGCRVQIKRITKTLSPADEAKAKWETRNPVVSQRGMKKKTRKQLKRARHRDSRAKNPAAGFVTKTVRVRPKSLKMTPAQQRAAPHPQAPGGWMYVQEQQRRLQQQQHQQQARVIQPALAMGALSESMTQADAADLSPQEVEAVVRDQAAAAR
ncbi:unnamed protein product [Ectocarpus sp. 12 AP-2014]